MTFVTAPQATQITLGGVPVILDDWVDDKLYATVDIGGRRQPPAFGELPGDVNQAMYRWPDILRWHSLAAGTPAVVHETLTDLRTGKRRMSRMLARTLVLGLKVRGADFAAVIDMFMATNFSDIDSEWALANLVDAAVERAADEHERLAEAWANAARERRWSINNGPPL